MLKKLIKPVITVVLAGSLVGGATLALWTAQTSVLDNAITAERLTVAIERDNGDIPPGPMFYTDYQIQGKLGALETNQTKKWYPGYIETRTCTVTNNNRDIKLGLSKIRFILKNLPDGEGYDAYDEFIEKMTFKVYNSGTELASGTLAEFMVGKAMNPALTAMQGYALSPTGRQAFRNIDITAELLSSAGDLLQNIDPRVDFVFTVNQVP